MLRLKMPKSNNTLRLHSKQEPDEFLAIPGSEPVTLIRVDSANLPFGCQCPLCGGLFEMPQGVLYRIEDDNLEDGNLGSEFSDHYVGPDSDFDNLDNADTDFIETASANESAAESNAETSGNEAI